MVHLKPKHRAGPYFLNCSVKTPDSTEFEIIIVGLTGRRATVLPHHILAFLPY